MVGVWTAGQTAAFLAQVRDHRLYAVFHLVALRGEAAGLTWSDLDLDAGTLTVSGQLQQLGGRRVAGPPKSDAGRRVIALDTTTIAALRAHRVRQHAERAAAGSRWPRPGYVFTTQDGEAGRAGPADPPVPPPGGRVRAAAGHLARAAARRRQFGTGCRDGSVDRPGPARSLHHYLDRRHLSPAVLPETARAAADDTAALLFLFPGRAGRARVRRRPGGPPGIPSRPG